MDKVYSRINPAEEADEAGRRVKKDATGGRRTANNDRHGNVVHVPRHRNAQQPLLPNADHEPNDQIAAQPQNQCVFMRGYMLTFRDDFLPLR